MFWFMLIYVTTAVASELQEDGIDVPTRNEHSCVPTAVAMGPCHTCICGEDKSYHCDQKDCEPPNTNLNDVQNQVANECEPHILYRGSKLWCTCDHQGHWKTNSCRTKFRHIKSVDKSMGRTDESLPDLKCESNNYYAVGCNICLCEKGKLRTCTKRDCMAHHKSDACKYGQLLRLDKELCACSHKGNFNNKHCIAIADEKYVKLTDADLKTLTVDEDSGKSTGDKCVPGDDIEIDCNRCRCLKNGHLVCTDKLCVEPPSLILPKSDASASRNVKTTNDVIQLKKESIEVINENKECEPGRAYKLACNVCKCNQNRSLVCTKMACLDSEEQEKLHKFEKSKSKKKYIGRSRADKKKTQLKKLPKSKCKPGEIYQKGCQRCFCNDKGVARCTNKPCNKLAKLKRVPEDVAPTIHLNQLKNLPKLNDQSSECKPGKTYRVDCNACLCLANGNTLCQDKLCPSIDDVNRLNAAQYDDKPCANSSEPAECVHCQCKSGKTECSRKPHCIPNIWRRSLRAPADGTLDLNLVKEMILTSSDKSCIPNMVYKQDCNKCYCQPDKSLRCTRKGCLSYTLVKKLTQHRQKLLQQEHE